MTRSMYNRNEWNYIGHSIDYVEGNEDTYSKPKACFDERLQILSSGNELKRTFDSMKATKNRFGHLSTQYKMLDVSHSDITEFTSKT